MSIIKTKTLLVKSSFSLSARQEQKTLIDYILEELKGIDVSTMKLDPAFLKYLCEVIENQVDTKTDKKDKSTTNPDKMDIFLEILMKLFPSITPQELDACQGIVEYLLKNKLIKKTKLSKIMMFYLKKKFGM